MFAFWAGPSLAEERKGLDLPASFLLPNSPIRVVGREETCLGNSFSWKPGMESYSLQRGFIESIQTLNTRVFSLTFHIYPASKLAFLNNYTEGQQEKILENTEKA